MAFITGNAAAANFFVEFNGVDGVSTQTFTPTQSGDYLLTLSGLVDKTGAGVASGNMFTNIGVSGNGTSILNGNTLRVYTELLSGEVSNRALVPFRRVITLVAGTEYIIGTFVGGSTGFTTTDHRYTIDIKKV